MRTCAFLVLLLLGVASHAQEFAPATLEGFIYTTSTRDPRDPVRYPPRSGILSRGGIHTPVNVTGLVRGFAAGPYTWVKTGARAGVLTIVTPNAETRLDLTFTSSAGGTYREPVGGDPGFVTGEFSLAALPVSRAPAMVNLSTRTPVAANGTAIQGFSVAGETPRRLLLRAVGPSLALFGVGNAMPDPALTVFSGTTAIAANRGWGGADTLVAAFASAGAFPLPASSRDCALILTLAPGNYTAQTTSPTGGEVLLEIYFLD